MVRYLSVPNPLCPLADGAEKTHWGPKPTHLLQWPWGLFHQRVNCMAFAQTQHWTSYLFNRCSANWRLTLPQRSRCAARVCESHDSWWHCFGSHLRNGWMAQSTTAVFCLLQCAVFFPLCNLWFSLPWNFLFPILNWTQKYQRTDWMQPFVWWMLPPLLIPN